MVHGDILSLDPAALGGDWAPHHGGRQHPLQHHHPIIFRLLRLPYPRDIVLTVQAEVAGRILAAPGSRTYGALTGGRGTARARVAHLQGAAIRVPAGSQGGLGGRCG